METRRPARRRAEDAPTVHTPLDTAKPKQSLFRLLQYPVDSEEGGWSADAFREHHEGAGRCLIQRHPSDPTRLQASAPDCCVLCALCSVVTSVLLGYSIVGP